MANVKISQLTAKGSNLVASDRLAIAEDAGGGTFTSKYVTGTEVKSVSINTQTGNYTLGLSDAFKLVELNSSTGVTLTVPLNGVVAFPIGTKINISQYGSGQVTVDSTIGVTIRKEGGKDKTVGQYSVATLLKRNTNEWYLYGDLTT
jgi:hypothetical protein